MSHAGASAGNVLLDRWNTAKVADVGLAKRLVHHHDGGALSTFVRTEELGTYAWAAPEVRKPSPRTSPKHLYGAFWLVVVCLMCSLDILSFASSIAQLLQVLVGAPCTTRADIFSFGVSATFLTTGSFDALVLAADLVNFLAGPALRAPHYRIT